MSESAAGAERPLRPVGPATPSLEARLGAGVGVVVIGGSAGSIEDLASLLRGLRADLPVPVLVVVHQLAGRESRLPELLEAAGPLRVRHPRSGERLTPGVVYVAPPDLHMTLAAEEKVVLLRGPRENRHRPAIDPLFRSAAVHYGPSAVGVILSGVLDDGSAGLGWIKHAGGITVVQDPEEARLSGMPMNAVREANPDAILPLARIRRLLASISERSGDEDQEETTMEVDAGRAAVALAGDRPGLLIGIGCPECHGTLWRQDFGETSEVRCRIGHAFSLEALASAHAESVELVLWSAVRVVAEQAALARLLADAATEPPAADRLLSAAAEFDQRSDALRAIVEQISPLRSPLLSSVLRR